MSSNGRWSSDEKGKPRSPFLDGELFNRESKEEWQERASALAEMSPFQSPLTEVWRPSQTLGREEESFQFDLEFPPPPFSPESALSAPLGGGISCPSGVRRGGG
ncbi:hypothetical protein LPW11_04410 [Geomonas sp. RF6]|uniref:hypothetical protein n=1 Tax=Geomonas sp. RF6 TaxID=2897342 RepID=UPI001E29EC76|nr:hypothetical protein [Geomonas sp. RF6]UFS71442.1 hypothetical protein LPW11_04410 [Geomonas sp. RF6]